MSNYLLFFLLIISSIIIERSIVKCKKETILPTIIQLLHHIVSIYLIFGSIIFGLHKIHLTIIIFILTLHFVNKGCILTHIYNDLCKLKKSHNFITIYDGLLYKLGYTISIIPTLFIIVLVILYDIYMIKICNK
jgi:hypothetical protein